MLPPACLPQTFFHVVKQADVPARCLIAWNRPEHSYVHSPTSLLAQIIAPLVSAKKPGECAYQHAMKCRFYWIECRSGLSVGYFRSLQIAHWRPHSNVCPSTMLGIWAPLTVKRKKCGTGWELVSTRQPVTFPDSVRALRISRTEYGSSFLYAPVSLWTLYNLIGYYSKQLFYILNNLQKRNWCELVIVITIC